MNNCTHDNDDHYFHQDAQYIEPDYYANNANKNMPIMSTIARGPQGDGVYAEMVASNEDTFIFKLVNDVTNETIVQSPNLSAGVLTVSQTDANPEEGVYNHAVFTVTRGGVSNSYDITIPSGSTGSRVYTLPGMIGRRKDDLYQWKSGDLIFDGHDNWPSKPAPRIYDVVMFSCVDKARSYLAAGVVRSVEKDQVVVTCQTYVELTFPHIGENGNWWVGEADTGIKAQGPKGDKGSFLPPSAKKLEAGSIPTVKDLSKDATVAEYEFGIPVGLTGETGAKGSFKAPQTKTLAAGSEATVRDLSDDKGVAEYEFGIPEGHTYKPSSASATTLKPGEAATAVLKTDVDKHEVAFEFGVPQGESGAALNIRNEVVTPDTLPLFDETPVNDAYVVDDGDGRKDLYIRGAHAVPESIPGAPWTLVVDWEGKPAKIGLVTVVEEPSGTTASVVTTVHDEQKENRYDFEFHLPAAKDSPREIFLTSNVPDQVNITKDLIFAIDAKDGAGKPVIGDWLVRGIGRDGKRYDLQSLEDLYIINFPSLLIWGDGRKDFYDKLEIRFTPKGENQGAKYLNIYLTPEGVAEPYILCEVSLNTSDLILNLVTPDDPEFTAEDLNSKRLKFVFQNSFSLDETLGANVLINEQENSLFFMGVKGQSPNGSTIEITNGINFNAGMSIFGTSDFDSHFSFIFEDFMAVGGSAFAHTIDQSKLPKATASNFGIVKPDNTSITIDSAGIISSTATGGLAPSHIKCDQDNLSLIEGKNTQVALIVKTGNEDLFPTGEWTVTGCTATGIRREVFSENNVTSIIINSPLATIDNLKFVSFRVDFRPNDKNIAPSQTHVRIIRPADIISTTTLGVAKVDGTTITAAADGTITAVGGGTPGPRGDKGDKGDPGIPGPKGDDGKIESIADKSITARMIDADAVGSRQIVKASIDWAWLSTDVQTTINRNKKSWIECPMPILWADPDRETVTNVTAKELGNEGKQSGKWTVTAYTKDSFGSKVVYISSTDTDAGLTVSSNLISPVEGQDLGYELLVVNFEPTDTNLHYDDIVIHISREAPEINLPASDTATAGIITKNEVRRLAVEMINQMEFKIMPDGPYQGSLQVTYPDDAIVD